ncbi:Solute carrier family 12 member 4 [Taenia crassiceps]|uniref:Solute carrier family 12 member 4 n=1 Tax=Taenia crassiceps TaxID=6207 RepID=A0ABR4Q7B1_9CEST
MTSVRFFLTSLLPVPARCHHLLPSPHPAPLPLCMAAAFTAAGTQPKPKLHHYYKCVCALGGRLIARSRILENGTLQCHKNITGPLYHLYCGENNSTDACDFFNANNVTEFAAIPGLASNMFYENILTAYYREAGQSYDDIGFPPSAEYGQASAIADITTSFTILIAIFFPSVTGTFSAHLLFHDSALVNPPARQCVPPPLALRVLAPSVGV